MKQTAFAYAFIKAIAFIQHFFFWLIFYLFLMELAFTRAHKPRLKKA